MKSFKAECWYQIYLYKRYLFNYLSDLFLLILMFMGIFWSGTLVGNGIIGSSLNATVIGYVLWTLIQNTISQMGMTVANEARNGILEQQYLMPISTKQLFFNKSIVNIITSTVQVTLVLLLIMFFTGHWLNLSLLTLLPFSLTLIATIGLGYVVVSLVLRFKRIGSTLIIFQYIYLAVLLINFEYYSSTIKILSCLLPICPMVSWIRLIVNQHSYNLPFYLVGSLFNAAFWLIIGLLVFNLTNKYIKQKIKLHFP